jgi:hypothetical protein
MLLMSRLFFWVGKELARFSIAAKATFTEAILALT